VSSPKGALQGRQDIAAALADLQKDGVTAIGDVIPASVVCSLCDDFSDRYGKYLNEDLKTTDAQDSGSRLVSRVGDRRYMITTELSGAFGDPSVYANPTIMAVVEEALGADFILENFGVVTSLPGAEPQSRHRDGPMLFDTGISAILPAHAFTVVIPLVEMNAESGSTTVWPGTHRSMVWEEGAKSVSPLVREGACIIWDYRLFHAGAANRSRSVRPIVYLTYARRWFQDPGNFNGKDRLLLSAESRGNVPDEYRHLFAHI